MRLLFEGLYGNEAAKKRFGAAVLSDTLPHAFLIDGPRGSGKKTLAYEITAALNCENKRSSAHALPCRTCNTCRRIFEGSYTDVKVLERKGGKASIGVDEVKDFKEDMFLSATESDYKVYVIDSAELLTPQAQNALLTVMEEPPPNVVIFLLSSASDKILTTIKSRAQYTAMEKFDRETLGQYLQSTSPEARRLALSESESFSAVLVKADGCIGRAKELLTPEGAKETEGERASVMHFITALDTRAPYARLYSSLAELPSDRKELLAALEMILSALSDLIKVRNTEKKVSTSFFDTPDRAKEVARPFSQKRLFKIFELVSQAHEYITKNASAASVISALAAKIKMI